MSKFIGRLVKLGLGVEAVRGAGVAPSVWVPKASENIRDTVVKARSRLDYGTIDGAGNVAPVALKRAEGSIELDFFNESMALFLLNLLGSVSTAANGDDTHTHTLSLSNEAQHDSLAMVLKDPDRDIMHKLAMVDSLTITIVPDDVVKGIVDIFAQPHTDSSNTSDFTDNIGYKFLGRHATLKIATLTGNLAAATKIPFKRITLRIKQNLMRDENCGTIQGNDILNTFIEVSGEIELNLENDTYRDYVLDGDYKALRLQLTNTNEIIGSGTQNPDFLIDLSRVDFDAWEPIRALDKIAKQTVNFTALFDQTNGNVINNLTITNERSSI